MCDFKKAVKVALLKKNLKISDLSERLGISKTQIYQQIKGNPTKTSIENIAYVLEMRASELIALGEDE